MTRYSKAVLLPTLFIVIAWSQPQVVQAQVTARPYEIQPNLATPAFPADQIQLLPAANLNPHRGTEVEQEEEDDQSAPSNTRYTSERDSSDDREASPGPTQYTYHRAPGADPEPGLPPDFARLIVMTEEEGVQITVEGEPYPINSLQGVLIYANYQYEITVEAAASGSDSGASSTTSSFRVITVRLEPGETRVLVANLGENDGSTVRRETRDTPSTRHDDDDEDEDDDETGYLGVSSSPRGIVYIDGDNTGQMTPARRIELDPGRHEVRLFYESEDEFSETKSVLIRAGVNTNVFFRYRREELSEDHED